MRIAALFSLIGLVSCHPLSIFRPQILHSKSSSPHSIEVAVDSFGIPFINATNLSDAMYALGRMHAYDRLFQLDTIRHAAQGRLSELFGKRTLSLDRKYRLLSYRLDEQVKGLNEEERELLESYVMGVNDGAQGQNSAEHFFLKARFENFSIKDVIAIARLQSWQLGADLFTELHKLTIAKSAAPIAIKSQLLSPIDDQNSAIIQGNYNSQSETNVLLPSYITSIEQRVSVGEEESIGASNAWVVQANLMQDRFAVLMNDPHLPHAWPSNFYLATIKAGDMKASGATFVGIPAILIGSSNQVAWGVTASYLNTQDSVYLKLDEEKRHYVVDGVKHAFKAWPQRFCLDKKGNCLDEEYLTSIFGPVIDSRYDASINKGEKLALMWTGFLVDEHKDIATSFARLIKAQDVKQAADIASHITLPGVNMVFADTKGDIAFSYAGLVPKRDLFANAFLPLDGSKSSSLWSGVLAREQKPRIINPYEGFIITANQNIFSKGSEKNYGNIGLSPYRAIRLRERLNALKAKGPLSFEELASLQLDHVSVEARALSPTIGRLCQEQFKNSTKLKKIFANELLHFDGTYDVNSYAALPFDITLKHIIKRKFTEILGLKGSHAHNSSMNYLIAHALEQEIQGKRTAIFSDNQKDSFAEQVKKSCEPAFRELIDKAGSARYKWRYGRHHYIYRQSPLAKAPVVGQFFRDKRREVAGGSATPLAEIGLPVRLGANLRFLVKMSNPPKPYIVLDSGNSGLPGHKNALDQADLWHQGKALDFITDWHQAKKRAKKSFGFKKPS